MDVKVSEYFKAHVWQHLAHEDRLAVHEFIRHVKFNGFDNLPGKLKCSAKVPQGVEDRQERIKVASDYDLWHYHVGTPEFKESPHGDYKTSDNAVIISRYQYHQKSSESECMIVGFCSHPIELPHPVDMTECKMKKSKISAFTGKDS